MAGWYLYGSDYKVKLGVKKKHFVITQITHIIVDYVENNIHISPNENHLVFHSSIS